MSAPSLSVESGDAPSVTDDPAPQPFTGRAGVQRSGRLDDFCPVCEKPVADLDTHRAACPKRRNPSHPPASATAGAAETGHSAAPLAIRAAPQLPTIERVKALLALCLTVDDASEIRDQARAVEAYYAQRADCLDIQNQAAAVRLRAERRIGEILRLMPKNKGGRPPETGPSEVPVPTLEDIGITKNQASVWQRIAAIADAEFEQRVAEAQENGLELTTSRVLRGPPPDVKARAASLVDAAAAAQPPVLPPLKTLARMVVAAHTRAELTQFCAWISGLAATDEQSPT